MMTSNRLEMTGKFFISNQNKIVQQKVDKIVTFLRECVFIMQEITANNSRSYLNYTKAARTSRSRMLLIW